MPECIKYPHVLDQIINTLGYSHGALTRILTGSFCNLINGDGIQSSHVSLIKTSESTTQWLDVDSKNY